MSLVAAALADPQAGVLLVHAHPDDETLATGPLIVWLTRRGVRVRLVTCTRGERGEVVPGVLPGSISSAELVRVRSGEWAAACAALGLVERCHLGSAPARTPGLPAREYLDSGMRWVRPGLAGPADDVTPDCLTASSLADEVADLVAAITTWPSAGDWSAPSGASAPSAPSVSGKARTSTQPSKLPAVVVSYDDGGGYGHPDHVRTRELALTACRQLGVPYLEITPDQAEDAEWFDPSVAVGTPVAPQVSGLASRWSGAVPSRASITDFSAIQRSDAQMLAALRCYRSQLSVQFDHAGPFIVHVGGQRQEFPRRVGLRLVKASHAEHN